MLNVIKLNGMVSPKDASDFAHEFAKKHPEYSPALAHWYDAFKECERKNLRYDRKRNILRDDDGIIASPSSPKEWPTASSECAKHELIREVWSRAVRAYILSCA